MFCKACGERILKVGEKPRCKQGHIMDPSWEACPLCTQVKENSEATPTTAPEKTNRKNTIIETDSIIQRNTIVETQNRDRKLIGFLVTYLKGSAGKYYEVNEGKQIIGQSNESDICIE